MNAIDLFRAEMLRTGLDYSGPILEDGILRRFKAAGDRARNSWYVLHTGPPMAGAFGCWKRQIKETFCEKQPSELTHSQQRAIGESWKRAEAERERAEKQLREKAKETAGWILKRSKPLTAHPYLTSKGVQEFGEARDYHGTIVLPLRDFDGVLHSLQFIDPDGTKGFLAGGRVQGCYFTPVGNPTGPLVICEGFATGATIYQATGFATVCAMNCANLKSVAEDLRSKWPDREIIVAADNDQWTDSNPGMTKATEAAKAIRAKLASPCFRSTTNKPTDFNDLHQREGLDTVNKQIAAAQTPTETDEEIYARLAALPGGEYDRCREQKADALRIRVGTLDKEVERLRGAAGGAGSMLQGRAVKSPDVEPWPQAVNGAEVLDAIAATFRRFLALPPGAADGMTLWAAHTHCFEAFPITPRLNICSPERGCGKTTARDLVMLFVPRPLATENLSVAVLFRVIQSRKPTVLADECDSWLGDNEELRGMLNAGHRRGGQALRCEGDSNEVRAFNVFAPAVLCGIGHLPVTLHDRSIVIRLTRAKPGELPARFDSRHTESETQLCRKLARWIADERPAFESSDPTLPDGAFNRLADNWRPLFAIAEVAGGDWPRRAAAAFAALTATDDTDAQGIGATLLADIRAIFYGQSATKISSGMLVKLLLSMEGQLWAEFGRDRKPITANTLARLLKPFKVSPRTLKLSSGDTAKGYHLADFADAFARYLPNTPLSDRNPVTIPEDIGDFSLSEPSPAITGLRIETGKKGNKDGASYAVTIENPQPDEVLL